MYKYRLLSMIIKGIIGFAIGFAIAYFNFGSSFEFWGGCMFGFIFAGLPYGWELFGNIIGGLIIAGDLPILVIMFMLRIIASILVGWIAYPIALIFYIVKAAKE